jgi:hypothetical protein
MIFFYEKIKFNITKEMEADALMEELEETLQRTHKIEKYLQELRENIGWDEMSYAGRVAFLVEIILDMFFVIFEVWYLFSFFSFLLHTAGVSILDVFSGWMHPQPSVYSICYF